MALHLQFLYGCDAIWSASLICFREETECTVVHLRGPPLQMCGAPVPGQLDRAHFPLSMFPEIRASLAARQPWEAKVQYTAFKGSCLTASLFGG